MNLSLVINNEPRIDPSQDDRVKYGRLTGTHFTIIGSRQTPQTFVDYQTEVALELLREGYIVRSGCAPEGGDVAATEAVRIHGMDEVAELYIPWERFDGWQTGDMGNNILCPVSYVNYSHARYLAELVHPAWDRCSHAAKGLHSRNPYQVLGRTLASPSAFVLFWAPTTKNNEAVKGGTATAVKIARLFGIPTFNLYIEGEREVFEAFMATRRNRPCLNLPIAS